LDKRYCFNIPELLVYPLFWDETVRVSNDDGNIPLFVPGFEQIFDESIRRITDGSIRFCGGNCALSRSASAVNNADLSNWPKYHGIAWGLSDEPR